MKNVTIALDDEIHRLARIRAAELGTSLSALVKGYLTELARGDAVPAAEGVREMPAGFHHGEAPPLPSAHPLFTRDGKPRQPGALRDLPGLAATEAGWDQGLIDSLGHWDEGDFSPLP